MSPHRRSDAPISEDGVDQTPVWWVVESLPDDFQQLLADWYSELFNEDLTLPSVPSRGYSLTLFSSILAAEQQHWIADDWAKTECYVHALHAGVRFPPLLVIDGKMVDGFHRTAALLFLRRNHFEVIELHDVCKFQHCVQRARARIPEGTDLLPRSMVYSYSGRTA